MGLNLPALLGGLRGMSGGNMPDPATRAPIGINPVGMTPPQGGFLPTINPKLTRRGMRKENLSPIIQPPQTPYLPPTYGPAPEPWEDYGQGAPLINPGTGGGNSPWNMPVGRGGLGRFGTGGMSFGTSPMGLTPRRQPALGGAMPGGNMGATVDSNMQPNFRAGGTLGQVRPGQTPYGRKRLAGRMRTF